MAILVYVRKILILIRRSALSRKGLWAIHIITTILLTLAVAFAAWHIKISYDESLSYYVLKTNDIKRMLGLANTHWLNSFFMKLSMLTIGDNVFSFRIASMIAFPFYATGLFKLSLQLKNNWLALACYVLLILHYNFFHWQGVTAWQWHFRLGCYTTLLL